MGTLVILAWDGTLKTITFGWYTTRGTDQAGELLWEEIFREKKDKCKVPDVDKGLVVWEKKRKLRWPESNDPIVECYHKSLEK